MSTCECKLRQYTSGKRVILAATTIDSSLKSNRSGSVIISGIEIDAAISTIQSSYSLDDWGARYRHSLNISQAENTSCDCNRQFHEMISQ
jgi:hypothetical protein